MKSFWHRPHAVRNSIRRFLREGSGAIGIWGAAVFPIAIGGAAFAVDLTRLYNMDHDLQAGVDALAKAGAAELDGKADSMTRARTAVASLVKNQQKFGQTAGDVKVKSVRFLSGIPSSADTATGSSYETLDPELARYIEVTLETETVSTVLPPRLFSGLVDIDMSASSTAIRAERVCGMSPMFMCNPVEGTGKTLEDALEDGSLEGLQVQLKRATGQMSDTTTSDWGPGSFGWLQLNGYSGSSDMREAVGIDIPDICMATGSTVQLRTGNINSMHMGFNTRFDIFSGSMSSKKTDPRYAPAENVTKGYSGNGCNSSPDEEAAGFPRDTCLESGNCSSELGEFGDGHWDFAAYMAVNHPGQSPVTIDGTTYTINFDTGQTLPVTPPSRYGVYRWEIDSNRIPSPTRYGDDAVTPENGAPQCHTSGPSTSGVDRRVFTVAVLNCQALDASGGMVSGRDLPVSGFAEMFLTEPVGSGSEPTIYGEIIGSAVKGIDQLAQERTETVR